MAKLELIDVGESALLARFTASAGSKNEFIFGRDGDGQPFVTQVTTKIQTIADAFDYLMPRVVKEAIAQGLDVKRQGDWFFIPVPEPKTKHSYAPTFHFDLEGIHRTSKIRQGTLYYGSSFQETRHTVDGQILYRAVGRHFIQGHIHAPDHPPLWLLRETWHLAVRRFSHNWEDAARRRQGGND